MNTQTVLPEPKTKTNGSLAAGIMLILFGLAALIFRGFDIATYLFLAMGFGFYLVGVLTREDGFMIPGGILTGLGLAIGAGQVNWQGFAGETTQSGMFFLAFALGWLTIPVMTRFFAKETHLWPLYPGGAMALIGALMMMGETGIRVLEFLGDYWPAALVIAGAALLIGAWRAKR